MTAGVVGFKPTVHGIKKPMDIVMRSYQDSLSR